MPQHMPLELLAMTPPIVQAEMLAGSGPSLRAYGASARLTRPAIVPGSTRTRRPSSSTVTPAPVAGHLDEHAVALRLPGQARPGRAEGHRHAAATRVGQQAAHLLDAVGEHDGLRQHPVDAGVGGEHDQLGRPGEHPLGRDDALERTTQASGVRRAGRVDAAAARPARRRAARGRPAPAVAAVRPAAAGVDGGPGSDAAPGPAVALVKPSPAATAVCGVVVLASSIGPPGSASSTSGLGRPDASPTP